MFWAWARVVGGVGILAVLLWRLGTGPFLAGVRLIDASALAAALVIGVVTTVCAPGGGAWSPVASASACRWRTAVAHCYRAVFLNATLPGGVLGDVHRAVRHGRDAGDVSRGIRAVVWERAAGQVVLVGAGAGGARGLPVAGAAVPAGRRRGARRRRCWSRCCWPGCCRDGGGSRWATALRTAVADVRPGCWRGAAGFGVRSPPP